MLKKKIVVFALIIAIIIQLAVPVCMIAYGKKAENDLEELGIEYKFEINAESIYDGKLYFNMSGYYFRNRADYGIVVADETGYAYFEENDKKPPIHSYVRFTEDNKQRLRSFDIDENVTKYRIDDETSYAIIKIYDGNARVVDVYIDGVPVSEWVELPPEATTYIEDEDLLFDEENLFAE